LPLQGVLSHGDGPAFTGPPLLRFNHPDHDRQEDRRSRVSLAKSKACLSQDCRPSWGLWPHEPSRLFGWRGILESPPRGPGVRHRLLVSPSSNPRRHPAIAGRQTSRLRLLSPEPSQVRLVNNKTAPLRKQLIDRQPQRTGTQRFETQDPSGL
jgi:hypothetical protein